MGGKGRAEGDQKETTTARISQGAGDKHRHTRAFSLKLRWTEAGVVVQIKLLLGIVRKLAQFYLWCDLYPDLHPKL